MGGPPAKIEPRTPGTTNHSDRTRPWRDGLLAVEPLVRTDPLRQRPRLSSGPAPRFGPKTRITMPDPSTGPRPRRSAVPLEALTPPWWADLPTGSAPTRTPPPSPSRTSRPVQVALPPRSPNPQPPTLAPSPALTPGLAAANDLVQRMRQVIRQRHYSLRTEKSYAAWVRRFLAFHHRTDPARLGAAEVRAYLTHLAVRRRVSASTQNQAFSSLLFLFREVLGARTGRPSSPGSSWSPCASSSTDAPTP